MRLLMFQPVCVPFRVVFQEAPREINPSAETSTRSESADLALDTLEQRIAQTEEMPTETVSASETSSEATSERPELDLKSVFERHPGKSVAEIATLEGEPFRKALIDAMFGSENIQFTLDDDPFCNRNAIERFCTPMLDWLDSLGCSVTEKQIYTAQMVRFYVIGDRMLNPAVAGGTDRYYDFRILHEGNDPTRPIRADRINQEKQDIIRRLIRRGLSSACFQFHEVVGHPLSSQDGTKKDKYGKYPKHLMHLSEAEFNARMQSFQTIIRTVTGDEDYRIQYVRTTGGGGMGRSGFKNSSLQSNAEKWNLSSEYWTAETDTGRKGGHMNGTQMQAYYLEQMKADRPFIPLMHFQRRYLDTFDSSLYDSFVRGYIQNTYSVTLEPSVPIVSPPKPTPAVKGSVEPSETLREGVTIHKVVSRDTLSGIAQKYGVSQQAIIDANPERGELKKKSVWLGYEYKIPPRGTGL